MAVALAGCLSVEVGPDGGAPYEFRAEHNPNGIGKFYLGREIAQVASPKSASWMERPARARAQRPDLLVENLELEPSDRVADVGTGTGYFAFRISPLVPEGKVLAVDIQQEMLDIIEARKREESVTNIETVLGTETDPKLDRESVDAILMVDAYHEFSHPLEMMRALAKALKPSGRLVLVEYRAEDPDVRINPIHKMSEAQARREIEEAGLVWRETREILPQQHFMVFGKP